MMGDLEGIEGVSGFLLLKGFGLISWADPLSMLMLMLLAVENRSWAGVPPLSRCLRLTITLRSDAGVDVPLGPAGLVSLDGVAIDIL